MIVKMNILVAQLDLLFKTLTDGAMRVCRLLGSLTVMTVPVAPGQEIVPARHSSFK